MKPLIFISHAAKEDSDIAFKFATWIIKAYDGHVAAFVSSADGIGPNQIPIEAIKENLNRAVAIVVLHTPNTTEKHWLSFETGWGCGGGKTVLQLLCKEAEIESLPKPITAIREIKSSEKPIEFDQILADLDKVIGFEHNPNDVEKLGRYLWTGEEENGNQNPTPRKRKGSRVWW